MAYHGFKPAEQAIQIGADEILSSHISDGVIVNADINSSAAIATSKVSGALTAVGSHGLATSATTDTTSASNISSGTLAAARVATLNQNTTGTAATVTTAAQPTITSVGTLTSLTTSGNIGLGATLDTWHSSYDALQGANFSLSTDASAGASKSVTLAYNQYIDSGNAWTYINADEASYYQQYNGAHYFATAGAGSADGDVTNSTKLTIANDGNATFAGAVQVSNNDLNIKMTTAGAGVRSIVDRVDTSDYAGFEVRTGSSQKWFIGAREDSTENLQFYSPATTSNVLSLNQTTGKATFAGEVLIHKASGDAILTLDSDAGGDPTINMVTGNNRDCVMDFKDGTTVARFNYDHANTRFEFKAHNTSDVDAYIEEDNASFAGYVNSEKSYTSTAGYQAGANFFEGTNIRDDQEGGAIQFRKSKGNMTSPPIDGTQLGLIGWSGARSDTGTWERGAFIKATATGTWNSSSLPAKLEFGINNTTHFSILSNGNKIVGNPSTGNQGLKIPSGGCPMELYVSTTSGSNIMEFGNPNGAVGSILSSGSNVTYNTSSDYRLKENETVISDGITRLKQLKPYRFNFKADANTTLDGFFAHEVSSIIPEAIVGEKDAVDEDGNDINQMIDHSKLVPLLVSALQEAIDRIEALENA